MAPWLVEICRVPSVGSYCPDSGMAQPLPCPPGGSSTAGQTSCHSCNDSLCGGTVAPRWSQPAHRSSQTFACRPGTYRDTTREVLACVVCPVGWYLSLHTCLFFYSCSPSNISLTLVCNLFLVATGHYCAGGVALPCPAGTYGPIEGLQRLRDCTICPAGRLLIVASIQYCTRLHPD